MQMGRVAISKSQLGIMEIYHSFCSRTAQTDIAVSYRAQSKAIEVSRGLSTAFLIARLISIKRRMQLTFR